MGENTFPDPKKPVILLYMEMGAFSTTEGYAIRKHLTL